METKTVRRVALYALGLFLAVAAFVAITSPGAADPPAKTIAAPAQLERIVPTVTVIDNTRGQWGDALDKAMRAWDRSPRITFQASEVPVPGTYNVYVSARDHQDSGWCGLASYLDSATMHILLNLSEGCAGKRDQRIAIAAHELGHALGIDHPTEDAPKGITGVIAGTPGGEPAVVPTGADYAAMREAQRAATAGVFALAQAGH